MIRDALSSGHPLGIFSGLLQLGALVFSVVGGFILRRDEKKAEAERRAKLPAPYGVPGLWPDR